MEDIKTYIESGILELYVMGDLSPAEQLEVERLAAAHPEIDAEITAIEQALGAYSNTYAIEPRPELRSKVLDSMFATPETQKPLSQEAKVVTLAPQTAFYKYAFAASVALLLLSWAGLFSIYSRLQTTKQQIATLQSSNQRYASQVNFIEGQLTDTQNALAVLRNPATKMIKLEGTKNAPQASMMVAFNPADKKVMIDLASLKMPANDARHQYQLWALVNGKPVDLGVFDMEADNTGMKQMKAVANAQAFAVTLEPRGGSVSPTMEQMMVMGSI